MNPPQPLDDDWDDNPYRGSEPLDAALADRFAFVLEMPAWSQLNERQQIEVIRASETPVCPTVCGRLRASIGTTRAAIPSLAESFSEPLAIYVRTLIALLAQSGTELSPRRGGMILRNILAVHAAYLTVAPTAKPADAAYLAVRHSLPQRALGQKVDEVKLLAAHREAWRMTGIKPNDPLRAILSEADPLRRAALAIRAPKIPNGEFSSIIADSLAALPMGSREALAADLFETGAAGRMVAAIAEQTAELYGHVALNPSFSETVAGHGERFKTWKHIEILLSRLDPENSETHLVANLLANHFAQGNLSQPTDVDPVLARWRDARQLLGGHTS
jgi:hypothetical protein